MGGGDSGGLRRCLTSVVTAATFSDIAATMFGGQLKMRFRIEQLSP